MDKVLEKALEDETRRQEENIELIASENYVSKDVLRLQGSITTDRYLKMSANMKLMVLGIKYLMGICNEKIH